MNKDELEKLSKKFNQNNTHSINSLDILKKTQEKEMIDHLREESRCNVQNVDALTLKSPPISLPPGPPPTTMGTKSQKKTKWNVTIGTDYVAKQEFIQVDPDIKDYPKRQYNDIKIVNVQSPLLPALKFPFYYRNLMSKFTERKPDFVIFPEASFQHYFDFGSVRSSRNPLTAEDSEILLKGVSDVIAEFGSYVILGSSTEIDGENAYNTSTIFNRNGKMFCTYRKRKLTIDGPAGDRVGIFETDCGTMAIMICFDIENKDILNETLAYNPKIIFNPVYIPNAQELKFREWKIKLKSMSDLFEKFCLDKQVVIIRSDQRNIGIQHGASGTSQIITPESTERVSSWSESFLTTFVSSSFPFQSLTNPPERDRTLETDNTLSRYYIDNYERTDVIDESGFVTNDIIYSKCKKGALFLYDHVNHNPLYSIKGVELIYVFKETIYFLQKKDVVHWTLEKGVEKCKNEDMNNLMITSVENQVRKLVSIGKVVIQCFDHSWTIHGHQTAHDGFYVGNYGNMIYYTTKDGLNCYNLTNDETTYISKELFDHYVPLNDQYRLTVKQKGSIITLNHVDKGDLYHFKTHLGQNASLEWKHDKIVSCSNKTMKCFEFHSNRIPYKLDHVFK